MLSVYIRLMSSLHIDNISDTVPKEVDNAGQLALWFEEQSKLEGPVRFFLYSGTVKGMLHWIVCPDLTEVRCCWRHSGLMVKLACTIILHWVVVVMEHKHMQAQTKVVTH